MSSRQKSWTTRKLAKVDLKSLSAKGNIKGHACVPKICMMLLVLLLPYQKTFDFLFCVFLSFWNALLTFYFRSWNWWKTPKLKWDFSVIFKQCGELRHDHIFYWGQVDKKESNWLKKMCWDEPNPKVINSTRWNFFVSSDWSSFFSWVNLTSVLLKNPLKHNTFCSEVRRGKMHFKSSKKSFEGAK